MPDEIILDSHRGRLRELFPITSFAGGLALSDSGVDLLSKFLEMDPLKVSCAFVRNVSNQLKLCYT